MPDGHGGLDEAEVEFHVTESETTNRNPEARGRSKEDAKDDWLGTGATIGLTGRLVFGVERKTGCACWCTSG